MIYAIAVCTKKQYREKFVTERQLATYKNKFKDGKIKDLIVVGIQITIEGFEKL